MWHGSDVILVTHTHTHTHTHTISFITRYILKKLDLFFYFCFQMNHQFLPINHQFWFVSPPPLFFHHFCSCNIYQCGRISCWWHSNLDSLLLQGSCSIKWTSECHWFIIGNGISNQNSNFTQRLLAFHFMQMPLEEVWIPLFSSQLWIISRTDWVSQLL